MVPWIPAPKVEIDVGIVRRTGSKSFIVNDLLAFGDSRCLNNSRFLTGCICSSSLPAQETGYSVSSSVAGA